MGVCNSLPGWKRLISVDRTIESTPSSTSSAAVRPMTTTIDDLPNEALCHVGSYLAKPSRALLGVAMVAPSESWVRRGDSAGPVGWLCQY